MKKLVTVVLTVAFLFAFGFSSVVSAAEPVRETQTKSQFTDTFAAKIKLKKPSTPKIQARAKRLYVTWKKVSSAQKISGYQVRYRQKGTSKWKQRTCKATASSIAFTNIEWGKAYQAQVRSYRTVGKTKYYSPWSGTANSKKIQF